jgi:hypothetical protein
MILPQLVQEPESRRELPLEFPPIVSDHIQPAALFRPVECKSGENNMSADRDAPSNEIHVRLTVLRLGEEVEDGPVVPNVEAAQSADLGDVSADPANFPIVGPGTPLAPSEGGIGDIENRHSPETVLC